MLKALKVVSGGLLIAIGGCGMEGDVDEPLTETRSALEAAGNDYGVAESFHTTGAIDFTNPMFLQLGTNPRSCATCHAPDQGWTMTADANKELFKESDGLAPLFNLVDEGNRPDADISTKDARKATFNPQTVKLALTRFTRNISAAAAAAAQYNITAVEDPLGFPATTSSFLNFRRPTHMANETKMSSILNTSGPVQDIPVTLAGLFNGAAGLHEQRDVVNNPVPVEQRNAGRDFALGLFFAQIIDKQAGRLDAAGALGGPANLSTFPFTLGMNDVLSPTFDRRVFTLFDAWAVYADDNNCHGNKRDEARGAIYRGQEVFNTNQFVISGVNGFNTAFQFPFRSSLLEAVAPAPPSAQVRPVAIDYGPARSEIGWFNESGKDNILRVIGRRGTIGTTVRVLAALEPSGDRKLLAHHAREAISAALAASSSTPAGL